VASKSRSPAPRAQHDRHARSTTARRFPGPGEPVNSGSTHLGCKHECQRAGQTPRRMRRESLPLASSRKAPGRSWTRSAIRRWSWLTGYGSTPALTSEGREAMDSWPRRRCGHGELAGLRAAPDAGRPMSSFTGAEYVMIPVPGLGGVHAWAPARDLRRGSVPFGPVRRKAMLREFSDVRSVPAFQGPGAALSSCSGAGGFAPGARRVTTPGDVAGVAVTTWLIDKSALVRLSASPDAGDWAGRIERGMVRITTVTPAGGRILDPVGNRSAGGAAATAVVGDAGRST
jgi:hypothetical protein